MSSSSRPYVHNDKNKIPFGLSHALCWKKQNTQSKDFYCCHYFCFVLLHVDVFSCKVSSCFAKAMTFWRSSYTVHNVNKFCTSIIFFRQIIITMTETIPKHELERQYTEGSLQEKPEIIEAEDGLVHPEFRLWLTTKTNVGLPLPAVLIQNGIKVACEAKENFMESVRTNFHVVSGSLNNCTPVWGAAAESSVHKVDDTIFFRSLVVFFLLPSSPSFSYSLFPTPSPPSLPPSSSPLPVLPLPFFVSPLLCHLLLPFPFPSCFAPCFPSSSFCTFFFSGTLPLSPTVLSSLLDYS